MADHRHILFIVIDSARKGRISAYGHDRETTPAFDELATEGTLFENAFVPAPWTLPSHWSMFTGQFPSEHGVTNGFTDQGLHRPDDVETIAETLSGRGYRTAGFSNNPWVGQLSGLDRGFDKFVEWDLETSRTGDVPNRKRDELYSRCHWLLGRAASQPQALVKRRFFTNNLTERATRWVAETSPDSPTFTFLNLMEAHSPYYPPKDAFKALGLPKPNPLESRLLNVRLLAYVLGKADLSESRRERVMEFYDASLRYQDRKLRMVLDSLREAGIYDDTLVVVCADHGKTLGDYDRDGDPPHYLRDVNTNVPMLVKPPGGGVPDRVETPVSLTDLNDLIRTGDVADFVGDGDGVLVEDHIPHTGKQTTDTTQWRALGTQEHKYIRSEDGSGFLVDRETDRLVDDATLSRRYRDRLLERAEELEPADAGGVSADGPIEGNVEGQLEDLGYLS